MKTGKRIGAILALVLACLVVGGSWPTEAQQEPLRVGMIQPLSGPIAAAGTSRSRSCRRPAWATPRAAPRSSASRSDPGTS